MTQQMTQHLFAALRKADFHDSGRLNGHFHMGNFPWEFQIIFQNLTHVKNHKTIKMLVNIQLCNLSHVLMFGLE